MSPRTEELLDRASNGTEWDRPMLQRVLDWPNDRLEELLSSAEVVRERHFGSRVKLKFLMNAKSGLCPEDCHYCSQSSVSEADIDKYSWRSVEELLEGARQAEKLDSSRYCIVASGRGPSEDDIRHLEEAVPVIKREHDLKICLSVGLLDEDQARRLAEAGVDIINHNLNTSKRYYPEICTTHTFEDRRRTLENVRRAGMTTCSGGIVGQGEDPEDLVELALSLKQEDPTIVPVNFLIPMPGTPLENEGQLTPEYCLKALSMFRLVLPEADLTISAGREWHLGSQLRQALRVGTSMFIGGYLTTKGEKVQHDRSRLEEAGYEVVVD